MQLEQDVHEVLKMLDAHMRPTYTVPMGEVTCRTDIKSADGPFNTVPSYRTAYPSAVVKALCELYREYNAMFRALMVANMEWSTDYQHCVWNTRVVNCMVQVDMVALPDPFLREAAGMPVPLLKEVLRRRIFEIENSLAMYDLLINICPGDRMHSRFKTGYHSVLGHVRKRFGKRPIALLAPTQAKYDAMCLSEFGHAGPISDEEVKSRIGFDRLFGPDDFRDYIGRTGACEYLLYVRSSDPVERLKDPSVVVAQPLLGDPDMRKLIKANALTMNVDAPDAEAARRINDTKEYMPMMGMGYRVNCAHELLGRPFGWYLAAQGIDLNDVREKNVSLRAKPLRGTYGCYGHIHGPVTAKFRGELDRQIALRKDAYVVQPEYRALHLEDRDSKRRYIAIDRNFFGIVGEEPMFLSGFRSMMPVDSHEAKSGRVHGNADTLWAEVLVS